MRTDSVVLGDIDRETRVARACAEALARLAQALATLPEDATQARARLGEVQDELRLLARDAGSLDSRYRSLLDAVPDAVTVHDADGRILEANRTACEVYGYSREHLLAMDVFRLNPDLPADHMDEVCRTFRLGHTVTVETENVRADGTRFPVEVHSNAFDDAGELRIVAVARDITLRRQAEFALRSSEERYRRLLDAVDKGILVQDRRGRIVSANAAAARALGFSPEELVEGRLGAREAWRFVDAHGRALRRRDLPAARALRSGRVEDSTLIGVLGPRLPGWRWFSASAVPQFLEGDSTPFQVMSLFSDVTALKREGELFEQTQALADIGGFELVFATDTLFLTDHARELLDLPEGARWSQFLERFTAADAAHLARATEAARRLGEAFELELRRAHGTSQRRWLRVIGRPAGHHGHVHGVSGTVQDVSLRRAQEEQLRRQALSDSLTGLSNRDAMLRGLTRAVEAAGPTRGPSVLYIDLDRFKVINDLLGHAAGDGLLIAAAQRLRETVPADALVARFGGDEFMVMLPDADADRACAVAEAITAAFSRPFEYGGEEFAITASVGLARHPEDGGSIQQLINHADAAMFDAKRRGRNKWQPFSPQLARTLTDRLLVETQLRRALDNNEFYLCYQPQVALADGRVLGAEALLRWRNRMLGELSPSVFIPHAENTGDIVRIGAWVIRSACRQMRAWRDAGAAVPRVAVNVSYRQFLSESLPEIVAAALREYALPGDCLELEMTERVLIEDVPDTLETFQTLKALGVHLVIDDFGEGHSALNYLRKLPFDALKISHTFMQGVPGDPTQSALCEAIIHIARSLGLEVIAEGVEQESQRRFLVEHGATSAQGFLFSRPVSAAEFARYAGSLAA